ncbi:MAG: alpha-L-fucosidase [Verrucomicrobiota bacterium]
MKTLRCCLLPLMLMASLSGSFVSAVESDLGTTNYMNETPAQRDARLKWWNEARFGMFIHWGIYSVPAGEWDGQTNYAEWFLEETHMPVSQYEKFADQFNPTNFDALAWVKAAKYAGVKYIVITSKHHDGFGMYRSDLTDWCIKRTPFQRDPLAELAAACKAEGIRFCLYYTIMDWHSPDWGIRRPWNDVAAKHGPPDMDRFENYMKGQLHELLTRYGPIGLLWFDGNWESPWTAQRGADIYNYVRSLQPAIIVNNRVGKPQSTPGGGFAQTGSVGDYGTPEQTIPPTGFGPGVYWESCMTINDHWGYNKDDQNFKSAETLVHNLIDCASKGGNYLLNIGPTSLGVIPGPELERLHQIGDWMHVNDVGVYHTSASPFRKLTWGRCTAKIGRKNTTLYLHVWDWPTDGKLVVPGLKNPVKSATLLATGDKLATSTIGDSLVIQVPARAPDSISSTIVLKIKGKPEVEATMIRQAADGSIALPAADADLFGGVQYESGNGKDDIGYWTDPGDFVSWTFRVQQAGKYQVTAATASLGQSNYQISMDDQKISGTAPNTGDYTNFQNTRLAGVLDVSSPRKVTLAVKPVSGNWSPTNLKSVTLTPVAN